MGTIIVLLVAAVLVLLAIVGLATPLPKMVVFYLKLYRAQRRAIRFYATCQGLTRGIAYHPSTSCRLDIYRPDTGVGHPVIIYVYGGSWYSGNKELYSPAAERLLPAGFVLVIPDYTLFPAAGYPRQTEEIAAAIAWTLDHAAEFGGDPRRVVVVAQSAGAQISGLALLEPRWLAAYGHSPAELRGFMGISGVYDVQPVYDHHGQNPRARELIVSVFGSAENFAAGSPMTHVSAKAPPSLLIHGDADRIMPVSVAVEFHRSLLAAGATSQLKIYPGAGHADILFRALTERPPRLFNDIVSFARNCTATASDVERAAGTETRRFQLSSSTPVEASRD